jgi:hypothetical protein
VPHAERLRAAAGRLRSVIRAHRQEGTDCGLPANSPGVSPMKLRAAVLVSIAIMTALFLGVAAIEIHHWVRFRHFVSYGVHADVLEDHSDIGIPGIKTLYAAEVFNRTLFPLSLVGYEYAGDSPPPVFYCRYQVQKLAPQDGHWTVVFDFYPVKAEQVPAARKKLYPLGSIVPIQAYALGARDDLRKGDLVRIAIFTNLYAAAADVCTAPFRIKEVRTTMPSPARCTR